jgi:hypothetical protein
VRRGPAIAAVAAALALAGCGGPPVDQTRKAPAFDRLVVSGGVHVVVSRGSTPGVTVHGRTDVLSRVVTDSSRGTLRVRIRDRGIVIGPDPMDDVRVRITTARLRDVNIQGHGDVDLGDVAADALRFAIHGAGDVRARGRVQTLSAIVHGAANADFGGLAARDARIEIEGAAGMTLNVSRHLDVHIRGAGDVRYRGDPLVTKDVQGAGDVTRIAP